MVQSIGGRTVQGPLLRMVFDKKINDLILDIYSTVADQRLWPEVLTRFADVIGARGCVISEIEGVGDARRIVTPYICNRYDADRARTYLDAFIHYELLDQERYEQLSTPGDAIDLIDQATLAGAELQAYRARPNIRQMRGMGISDRVVSLLDKDNPLRARFSVHFNQDSPGFTAKTRALMNTLLPHVAKAIEVGRATRQLNDANQHMMAAMDRLRMGVCVLDRYGRIEAANGEFRRQVDAYPAYAVDRNNRLHLHHDRDQKRLNDLLGDVLKHGRFGARPRKEALVISTEADAAVEIGDIGSLCVEVAPLQQRDDLGAARFDGAIVYSLDTSQPMPFDPEMMQRRFQLSKTETELLLMVAEGLSNAQIADRRNRATDTVNAQLKALLGKTGAKNRTHLVRLMACFGTDYLLPRDRTAAE